MKLSIFTHFQIHSWEIIRFPNPNEDNRFVDVDTKTGDLGAYSNIIGLLPEYGVDFVVLTTGAEPGQAAEILSPEVIKKLIPALEDAARDECTSNLAGTYSAHTPLKFTSKSLIILTTEVGNLVLA